MCGENPQESTRLIELRAPHCNLTTDNFNGYWKAKALWLSGFETKERQRKER